MTINYDPVSDTTVTLYSKDACMQCKLTKDYFVRNNIKFIEYNTDHDEQAAERARALGYMAAPVIVSGFDHWSGLRPDKLANIPR